jgi:hypothetical protein
MPSVTVCVSASSTQGLSTVDTFRGWLGSTATCDDVVQQYTILRASRWAESVIGYPTPVQIYSETVPGFGGRELLLSRTPILRVLRVFDSTTTCEANVYTSSQYRVEDAEAGILSMDAGFPWTALRGLGVSDTVIPNSERRSWLVEYVAGWTPPAGSTATCSNYSTSTGPTLPADIEQAVLIKAREFLQGDANVLRKQVGDLSIEYYKGNRTQSYDPAYDLLVPYRRVAI